MPEDKEISRGDNLSEGQVPIDPSPVIMEQLNKVIENNLFKGTVPVDPPLIILSPEENTESQQQQPDNSQIDNPDNSNTTTDEGQ